MPNEITQTASFNERMRSKIRESIGELLTEDEIQQMVNQGMKEVFFSPRSRPGYNTPPAPPLIHELVEQYAGKMVKEVVRDYLYEHANVVIDLLKPALERNLGEMVLNGLKGIFSDSLGRMEWNLQQQLRDALGMQ